MSKKKVYVLYSIAGEISPKLYKTKATVQKYLSKNKNLSFYEFPNETSAQ